ncbi:hypothetical protein [Mycolicibacterium fortuitum]|uniref:hypothetical protein n=1 Tax=Mycolicibacterium fortuitum TaxID=1766 RepID=UPI003AAEBFD0
MRKIRRRTGGPEAPPPAPPPPPPPPQPRTADELVDGRTGVTAALWGLAKRKLRELRGRRWEAATQRERVAEADRRARQELAKRIERETGRRPAERTLRRHKAAGSAPRGVDEEKMARQAAIDNAGSIAKFGRQYGMSASAVKRWRDHGGDLPEETPESLRFEVAFVATLFSKGERYKTDQLWHTDIYVDGDAVARIAEASRTGDYGDVADLIGSLAADQFPWVGAADRSFEVSEVIDITIAE